MFHIGLANNNDTCVVYMTKEGCKYVTGFDNTRLPCNYKYLKTGYNYLAISREGKEPCACYLQSTSGQSLHCIAS